MITTIKTKIPVLYDSINQGTGIVYLGIGPITFDGQIYTASTHYYTINDAGVNIFFSNGESRFTNEEADSLFIALGISGDTFTTKFINLIANSAKYQVGTIGVFALTSVNWELV